MVVHPSNPSEKVGAEGSLRVSGQPGPHREFQASQGHTVKPCLKQKGSKIIINVKGVREESSIVL